MVEMKSGHLIKERNKNFFSVLFFFLIFSMCVFFPSPMSYKQLHRQLRRLPLPQPIITDGGAVLKRRYVQGNINEITHLLNIIVYDEQYKQIPKILDFIYKDTKPEWWGKFMQTLYVQVKDKWPVIHLVDEINHHHHHHHHKPMQTFSVAELIPGKPAPPLPLLTHYSSQHDELSQIIHSVNQLYNFIISNRGVFGVSKHVMEVLYIPSALGTDQHPINRDKQLREKLSLVKKVINEFPPITKPSLDRLLHIHRQSLPINKSFFKHIAKHRSIDSSRSATARALLRREFVPNTEEVHEIISDYLHKQYYLQDNKYVLNLEN